LPFSNRSSSSLAVSIASDAGGGLLSERCSMRPDLRDDARAGIRTANGIDMIARPTRQQLNRMTQFEPIGSRKIGAKLGDNLAFKLSTLGRFSRAIILARLKAVWLQIRHALR
jgi:hypothetical protein